MTSCACNALKTLVREEVLPGPFGTPRAAIVSDFKAFLAPPNGHGAYEKGRYPMALVDCSLRVQGVEGLGVVDASWKPSPLSLNTVVTFPHAGEDHIEFHPISIEKGLTRI